MTRLRHQQIGPAAARARRVEYGRVVVVVVVVVVGFGGMRMVVVVVGTMGAMWYKGINLITCAPCGFE